MKNSEVLLTPESVEFLNELTYILIEKEYFSFIEQSKKYTDKIYDYFQAEIPKLHRLGLTRKAKPYFKEKYGIDCHIARYKYNNQTSWYALFANEDNRYIVLQILNNHANDYQYIDRVPTS